MSNLNKRTLTSIPLLILVICTIYNNIILVLSLYIVSAILIYEFSNILKKIFKSNKKNFFIFINLFVFYICIFASQIYFYLSGDFENKQNIFLFILLICIFTDIGGYMFGKIFKGKKLTLISPNKTYAGMIGSFLLSIIASFLFAIKYDSTFLQNQNLSEEIYFIFLVFLISSVSQIGDLIISYFKRLSKIKNTGNIFPGHGGLLDRIDGMIFAFPFIFLVSKILL